MFKEIALYLNENKENELWILGLGLSLGATVFFTDSLPSQISAFRTTYYWILLGAIEILTYTIIRVLASVILFTVPFSKFGWVITVLMLFFSSLVIMKIFNLSEETKASGLKPQYIIEDSNIVLKITCDGNALFKRTHRIIPQRDLDSIVEYDIYSSGGLVDSNITFQIQEISNGNIEIPCETAPGTAMMNRLVNRFTKSHRLKKGNKYTRVMKINAIGAFVDSIQDAYSVIISNPTNVLRSEIKFEGDCFIDETTVELHLIKERGMDLSVPRPIVCDLKDSANIVFVIYEPDIGNRYRLIWKYLNPPIVNIDE